MDAWINRLRLGRYLVDFSNRTIGDGHQTTTVSRQAMLALELLTAKPGETVQRAVFHQVIWKDQFRTEDVLNQAIRELRRALADDVAAPQFIATQPRIGYRLLARPQSPYGIHWALQRIGRSAPVAIAAIVLAVVLAVFNSREVSSRALEDWPLVLVPIQFDTANPGMISLAGRFDRMLAHQLTGVNDHQAVPPEWLPTVADSSYDSPAYGSSKMLAGRLATRGDRHELQVRLVEISSQATLWQSTYPIPAHNDDEWESTLVDNIVANLNSLLSERCMEHLRNSPQLAGQ